MAIDNRITSASAQVSGHNSAGFYVSVYLGERPLGTARGRPSPAVYRVIDRGQLASAGKRAAGGAANYQGLQGG